MAEPGDAFGRDGREVGWRGDGFNGAGVGAHGEREGGGADVARRALAAGSRVFSRAFIGNGELGEGALRGEAEGKALAGIMGGEHLGAPTLGVFRASAPEGGGRFAADGRFGGYEQGKVLAECLDRGEGF